MSYILDALRKSHRERHPTAPERTGAVHNISISFPISGAWLAVGIVLLAGLLIAVSFFWRSTAGKLPDPPLEPVASEALSAPPAPAQVPTPVPATPASIEKETPPPPVTAKDVKPVADLAEQAKVQPPPAPRPKKIVSARPQPKPVLSKETVAVKPSVVAAAIPLVTDDTPLLQQMPQEFQRALPLLAVTIHVYAHEESQRILFINNREYRRGSQLDGGIRVEEIVPDGAVLSFRGERFKLSRPR